MGKEARPAGAAKGLPLTARCHFLPAGRAAAGWLLQFFAIKLLNNRVYVGEAVHKGVAWPGEHEAIIAQAILAEAPRTRASRSRAQTPALLRGLIFNADGRAMSPSHILEIDVGLSAIVFVLGVISGTKPAITGLVDGCGPSERRLAGDEGIAPPAWFGFRPA